LNPAKLSCRNILSIEGNAHANRLEKNDFELETILVMQSGGSLGA